MSLHTIKAWINRRARDTEEPSGQVKRLYAMLHVELLMSTTIDADVAPGQIAGHQYVVGRQGGYRFVIKAMEMYWPDLVAEGERLRAELDDVQ